MFLISKHLSFSISLVALVAFAVLSAGLSSCSEPSDYCKYYGLKADQAECTSYCANDADFGQGADKDDLVKACQLGQVTFLTNAKTNASEALLSCDRYLSNSPEYDQACRVGVTAEELRLSKSRSGAGTSDDRETGNGR